MTGLGKEYGEALYELARDERMLDQLHGELTQIGQLLKAEPDFVKLLSSRAIERDLRIKVVDDTFSGRAHDYIVNFMKLLVEKERIQSLPDCIQWYHQRYLDDLGIVEANVTSAVDLTEDDLEALRQKLEHLSNKKVSISARVDPSIIGGLRVEMDGRLYDNTIQNKLGRLKQQMARGI